MLIVYQCMRKLVSCNFFFILYICAVSVTVIYYSYIKDLGKPQKKVHPLVAGPLRGGVKAGPLRKKELFLRLFFYFVAIYNKNYFTLDNLSKYGHITLKFVGRYF